MMLFTNPNPTLIGTRSVLKKCQGCYALRQGELLGAKSARF